jgi:hypothetical protein
VEFVALKAVRVKLKLVPDVAAEGAETVKCVAGGGLTVIGPEFPATVLVAVSVAVIDCAPAVFSVVTVKRCEPLSAAVKV